LGLLGTAAPLAFSPLWSVEPVHCVLHYTAGDWRAW